MASIDKTVELDEFDNYDIAGYLVHEGYKVTDPDGGEVTIDKKRWSLPELDLDIDIDFDDLDEDDLVDYLESSGYICSKNPDDLRLNSNNPIQDLARETSRMAHAHKGTHFWREYLTSILCIPYMADREVIAARVRELVENV